MHMQLWKSTEVRWRVGNRNKETMFHAPPPSIDSRRKHGQQKNISLPYASKMWRNKMKKKWGKPISRDPSGIFEGTCHQNKKCLASFVLHVEAFVPFPWKHAETKKRNEKNMKWKAPEVTPMVWLIGDFWWKDGPGPTPRPRNDYLPPPTPIKKGTFPWKQHRERGSLNVSRHKDSIWWISKLAILTGFKGNMFGPAGSQPPPPPQCSMDAVHWHSGTTPSNQSSASKGNQGELNKFWKWLACPTYDSLF